MYGLDDICDIKKSLIDWAKSNKECSAECIPLYGQVIDMIKDLYEAEKDCYKAWYYAMAAKEIGERSPDEEDRMYGRMGYDHYRYASGRFAPKGKGHYSAGYHPMPNPQSEMMPIEMRTDIWETPPMMTGRYGYPRDDRHGRAYNDYDDARRHYHESKDPTAKKEMDEHARHHVDEVIMTSKDIYKEASPELRQKLKNDFTKLVSDFGTM